MAGQPYETINVGKRVRQMIADGELDPGECSHVSQIQDVTPGSQGCQECLQMGDTWIHLRICLICGHVGCCDSSKNKHASKHYRASGHPLVQSLQPDEDWVWCFKDEVLMS